MMTYEEAAAVRTYSDAEIGTLWDAFLSIVPDECNLDTKVQRDLLFALCKTAPYCRETEFPDGTIELVGRFPDTRGCYVEILVPLEGYGREACMHDASAEEWA